MGVSQQIVLKDRDGRCIQGRSYWYLVVETGLDNGIGRLTGVTMERIG